MKKKLKIIKLLLTVFMGFLIVLAVCFLVHSYSRLSDKHIPESYFYNKLYVTQDSGVKLTFGDSLDDVNLNISPTALTGEYKENVLTLTDGFLNYVFIVIDDNTLFGDVTGYMYLIGGLK